MKSFDVVLVVGYFRSATAYLSIIRHLSARLRIGIVRAEADPSLQRKTGDASDVFMDLCVRFGAERVEEGTRVRAKLMVVQQFVYPDEIARAINACVEADRRVGLMTLAMSGVAAHDRFLEQFGISRVYVQVRRFFDFQLDRREAHARYENVEVVQVGLPFRSYPVFPEFAVDYLIVAPTTFSFRNEKGKQDFLLTLLELMEQIPRTDTIAYKPHNGQALDYFAPRLHYFAAKLAMHVPGALALVRRCAERASGGLKDHLERVVTSALHQRVLERVVPMHRLTDYSSVSVEAFFPGVRKGVIGGLSNTIWGALYFGIDYYNCVDVGRWKETSRERGFKNPAGLLELNLEYFSVPYCAGVLTAGPAPAIVNDADREGDLIAAVANELAAAA